MGGANRETSLGGNEIHDALCLGEIEFSVEKCPLGKLAGRSVDGSAFEKASECFPGDQDSAVTRKLDCVLTGKRVRSEKYSEQAVINHSSGFVPDFTAPCEARHGGGSDSSGAIIRDAQCV